MGYSVGVDLGTTYSAAAVHEPAGTRMVSLGYAMTIVPSAVLVTPEGETLVGEAALRRGATMPDRLAREFKRRIGDSVPVLLGGSPFSAEALTGRLLAWIVGVVAEQQGGPPEHLAVTHPANWGPFKQDRLAQAIRLADLDHVVAGAARRDAPADGGPGRGDGRHEVPTSTLTEPEAAAISYAAAERVPVGEVVAVYDLGGGTFDGAVLRKAEVGFEVLGTPEGIERLGGIDVDEAVFRHVVGALDGVVEGLAADDPVAMRAVSRLRQDCVEAKEALSSDTEATIPVVLPGRQTELRLTRSELEEMVRPVLGDTVRALRRAIASADLSPAEVDRVLLVGGSSRIPLVAEMVTEALGRPVFVDAHPKHAVALGAALAAAGLPDVRTDGSGAPAGRPAPAPAVAAATGPDRAVSDAVPYDPEMATVDMASRRDPLADPTIERPDLPPPPAQSDLPPPPAAQSDVSPVEESGGPAGVRSPTPGDGTPDSGVDALADVGPGAGAAGQAAPPDGPRRRRRGVVIGVGVVAAIAVLVVAVVLLGGGDGGEGGGGDAPGTTEPVVPELAPGEPVAVAAFPDGLAVAGDRLVVASTFGGTVTSVDPATGAVAWTVELPGEPLAVLSAEGSIWVTQRAASTVARLDPSTGEVVATIDAPGRPVDLDAGAGSIWVAGSDGVVTRIDPDGNRGEVVAEGIDRLSAVVASEDRVWLTHGTDQVAILDPGTGRVTPDWGVAGENTDEAVLTIAGLWVLNRGEGTVSRLDHETGEELARLPVGTEPAGIVADGSDGNRLWVVDNTEGTLVLIHAPTGRVLARTAVGPDPLAVATTPGTVWVSLSGGDAVVPVTVTG